MKEVASELEGIRQLRMGGNVRSFHIEVMEASDDYAFDSRDFGPDNGLMSCFEAKTITL